MQRVWAACGLSTVVISRLHNNDFSHEMGVGFQTGQIYQSNF